MTTAAKRTFQNELWMGPAGGTPVKVAELRSITPPKPSRDTIDVTTHDSAEGAMEFLTSKVYDPGTLGFSINHVAGSTDDEAFEAAFADAELRDFKIVVKKATGTQDRTFSGVMLSYGMDEQPVNGVQTASGSVKLSGPITRADTPTG